MHPGSSVAGSDLGFRQPAAPYISWGRECRRRARARDAAPRAEKRFRYQPMEPNQTPAAPQRQVHRDGRHTRLPLTINMEDDSIDMGYLALALLTSIAARPALWGQRHKCCPRSRTNSRCTITPRARGHRTGRAGSHRCTGTGRTGCRLGSGHRPPGSTAPPGSSCR